MSARETITHNKTLCTNLFMLLPNSLMIVSLPCIIDGMWSFVYSRTITMYWYVSSTNQDMLSLVMYQNISNTMCQPVPMNILLRRSIVKRKHA